MHPLIKQLYNQSYKDEDGANAYHALVFDIEAFAQRLVFRCATAAKLAQLDGDDAYTAIMQKYGAEVTNSKNMVIQSGDIPLVGETNELI